MSRKIRIKFSGRIGLQQNPVYWKALFAGGNPVIGDCEFIFDPERRDYDWLVVYEDLMHTPATQRSMRIETLACARDNTLLIMQEPASIKIYGAHFLAQFGHVLSAQPQQAVKHRSHIHEVSPIRWFYGRPLAIEDKNYTTVDQFNAQAPLNKTKDLSTVVSDKQMTPVLKQRYDFTTAVKKELGDKFDWYGRGIQPINDKSEAMNNYRYQLAIENDVIPHYWTDKISDSFLAFCLPFYYGHENISAYFSPESYIPIDIYDPEAAVQIISKAIADKEYEKRLPAIIKARTQVLTEYNLMNIVARHVTRLHQPSAPTSNKDQIMGRHIFRKRKPLAGAIDAINRGKIRAKLNRL